MKKYTIVLLGIMMVGAISCTSLSEGSNTNEIETETQSRVLVDGDGTETLRDQMDEQSSEINRKRNIEEQDQNKPAMTPPALRPQRVEQQAPANSGVVRSGVDWLSPNTFRNRVILD